MAKKPLPTPDDLRQLLRYEPETGKLFWRERTLGTFKNGRHSAAHSCAKWNAKHAGKEAFTPTGDAGYRQGSIFSKKLHAHRVIWAMTHNEWPSEQIDHINGIRDDNRLINLRIVSRADNQRNQKRRIDNTSGITGVSWDSKRKKWCAEIQAGGKKHYVGRFDSLHAATVARKQAEHRHGFHANHGRP